VVWLGRCMGTITSPPMQRNGAGNGCTVARNGPSQPCPRWQMIAATPVLGDGCEYKVTTQDLVRRAQRDNGLGRGASRAG